MGELGELQSVVGPVVPTIELRSCSRQRAATDSRHQRPRSSTKKRKTQGYYGRC